MLCGLVFASALWSGGAAAKEPPPLRLAIFHPFSHLCQGQETGQRDRRLLRLVYWVARPGERGRLPWYFDLEPSGKGPAGEQGTGAAGGQRIVFDPKTLWGEHQPGGLLQWRAAMLAMPAMAPGLLPGPAERPGVFQFHREAAKPLLYSLLSSTGLIPFPDSAGVPPGLSGAGSETTPAAPPFCRSWPRGVTYSAKQGALRYRITRGPGIPGPAFTLGGYRALKALLRDLDRGRLDAALLDGKGAKQAAARRNRPAAGVIAAFTGTQQVILRIAPRARAAFGGEGIRLLSQALARRALSDAAGPGFAPARSFLEPLVAVQLPAGGSPLRWDSLAARREWMKKERPEASIRFGVLAHPLLERVASGMAGQWKRTLNLSATVTALPVEGFHLALSEGELDLGLDVADLDDGSLQELWFPVLESSGGDGRDNHQERGLPELERRLQARLPFLPILSNRHFLIAPTRRAFQRAAVLCPGCKPINYGAFLRSK